MSIVIEHLKIVQKKPGEKSGSLAMASINIKDTIVIHGCRLIEGKNGYFVGMPSRQDKKTEKWLPMVAVLKDEMRSQIADAFKKAYEESAKAEVTASAKTEEDPF